MIDIRSQFPILTARPGLVYLDSAATSLTPTSVIDAISSYYGTLSSNVGRGLYATAEETTSHFEAVREQTAKFLGADADEIVFTRNTTESINLLASVLEDRIHEGDNIVVTALEHHSNFLPWKRLAGRRGAELRIVPFGEDGSLDLQQARGYIDSRTKVFAFSAISNVLGATNPVAELIRVAKETNPNILTVVDAAQAAGHSHIDVREWNCDFLAFSGHKCFGPTGIGVLYGKEAILSTLPPYQVGGGMVQDASAEETAYKDSPHRFEAGTPDIAAVFGLGAALDFVEEVGIDAIHGYESTLATKAVALLHETFGNDIQVFGPTSTRQSGIVSFTLDGIHPHDIAHILGEHDICVRAGEHCAAPLHRILSLPATARATFSIYNTEEDVQAFIEGLKTAVNLFRT